MDGCSVPDEICSSMISAVKQYKTYSCVVDRCVDTGFNDSLLAELTPCSSVLEKPTVAQPHKIFTTFYANPKVHYLEECRLLGCGTVQILCEPTFRRSVSPPSSG
jgi:hypothetical protein